MEPSCRRWVVGSKQVNRWRMLKQSNLKSNDISSVLRVTSRWLPSQLPAHCPILPRPARALPYSLDNVFGAKFLLGRWKQPATTATASIWTTCSTRVWSPATLTAVHRLSTCIATASDWISGSSSATIELPTAPGNWVPAHKLSGSTAECAASSADGLPTTSANWHDKQRHCQLISRCCGHSPTPGTRREARNQDPQRSPQLHHSARPGQV